MYFLGASHDQSDLSQAVAADLSQEVAVDLFPPNKKCFREENKIHHPLQKNTNKEKRELHIIYQKKLIDFRMKI